MLKRATRIIGNIKLTTMISMLVISAIIVSIIAVTAATYVNLNATTRDNAMAQLERDLRTAATIVGGDMPGAQVTWAESGEIDAIKTWAMPRLFVNHDLIDSVVRLTGETAALFGAEKPGEPMLSLTSTLLNAEGGRSIGVPFPSSDPAYAVVMAGQPHIGETTVDGVDYYSAYQPIVDQEGGVVGVLYIGTDKATLEAGILQTLSILAVVGAVSVAILGVVGYFLSRLMMGAVPRLAQTMKVVADGDYDASVAYLDRGNELGDMARAVEVFRQNGLKMSQMTEEERAASQRRRIERTDMMVALQAAFGEVVDAAIAGDFTKRVHAQFPDAELNSLAGSVNNLVETVDRGVSETGTVLAALADTNLTSRMTGDYQGSFAKLKADTNAVADKLTEVVTQLRSTSRAIKTATGELLSGANDLSERTTKQAATIEETSAAMEQLAQTVADNARMAADADGKAQTVSRSAAQSGVTMGEANAAMERITASSAKISNIIGMIDDIAFQTNLLALNASVEAARAGDAGKGFAVVAVEVRRLAQSAASASADVKVLVEQSATEVKGGSRLVSNAVDQLAAMQGAVEENASLMQSIAQASREQASAIDEVSVAVRTMDEMTQHNAALVEETNAAIEQTEAQASELDRVVDIFTIDAHEDTQAPRVAASARAAVGRVRTAARSYLSQGNAAVDKDWAEF